MALEKININFSGINNITPLDFDVPSTAQEWITEIPRRANEITGGFLSVGVLLTVLFVFYVKITDVSQYGEYRYSKLRGVAISSIIAGIVGINLLQIGYIQDYAIVGILLTISLLSIIMIKIEER